MNGKKLTAMGLIVTLSITAAACGSTEEVKEVSKVAVEVQNPRVGELTLDTAYIGTVAPQEQVYVIPKTSGTVTETFFEVGDTVQAGDVLFKIDDEAAQLQLANAEAAYNYAQAGVTAQNSGARDLQNYQTERQIQLLRESLWDTDDQIDDLEDTLGDVRDAGGPLTAARDQAQAQVNQLTQKLGVDNQNVADAQAAYDQVKDNGSEEDKKAAEEALAEAQKAAKATGTELALAQVQLNTAQTSLDSLNATKTQLKSGIEQIENGQDTIRDNLTTAEQAYSITQNEVYPQSDAVSAAQLQQVAVGIDSAKMQLDFCTVTAPISGIVESVNVEKNGMAAAGNPAYIISNKDSMKVTFNVTEQAKNTLAVGDHITVERNDMTYDGTITEIGTMAGQQTRLFAIEAAVMGASDSLPSGVSVKVYATTQKEAGKLIVPYDAVYFSAGDAYVYCVENDTIVKTAVTVGLMNDTEVVVEEGLTEDSLVVDNWSSKLRNGAEVDVVSINGEAAESPKKADMTEEAE